MEKQTQHHPPVYPLLPPAPVEELDIDMVRRQAAQIYRETYAVSDEELDEKFRREGCTSTALYLVCEVCAGRNSVVSSEYSICLVCIWQ